MEENTSDSSRDDAPHKAEAASACVSKYIVPTNSGRQEALWLPFQQDYFKVAFFYLFVSAVIHFIDRTNT